MSYDPDQVSYNTPLSPRQFIWNTPEERAAGINNDLKVAARRYLCPNCGREFSLFQSRAVACKFCPQATNGCPNVRCPYCDKEYPIKGFIVPDNNPGAKYDERHMNDYTSDIFKRFEDGFNRR